MSRNIMDQISKLYISCLDNDEIGVSPSILGRCLATGCRTSTKTNYATQWQETLMKLVGTIHQSLDRLFDTIDEGIVFEYTLYRDETMAPLPCLFVLIY